MFYISHILPRQKIESKQVVPTDGLCKQSWTLNRSFGCSGLMLDGHAALTSNYFVDTRYMIQKGRATKIRPVLDAASCEKPKHQ